MAPACVARLCGCVCGAGGRGGVTLSSPQFTHGHGDHCLLLLPHIPLIPHATHTYSLSTATTTCSSSVSFPSGGAITAADESPFATQPPHLVNSTSAPDRCAATLLIPAVSNQRLLPHTDEPRPRQRVPQPLTHGHGKHGHVVDIRQVHCCLHQLVAVSLALVRRRHGHRLNVPRDTHAAHRVPPRGMQRLRGGADN